MTTITLPSADQLSQRLGGIDGLLIAKKWERAAIVYAFTQPGSQGGIQVAPPPPKMNIRTFAAQGFAGLTSLQSVYHYRRAWEWAIAQGWAKSVEPGETVVLPHQEFPRFPKAVGVPTDTASFAEAIRTSPQLQAVARRALQQTREPTRHRARPVERLIRQDAEQAAFRMVRLRARVRRLDAVEPELRDALREYVTDALAATLEVMEALGLEEATVTPIFDHASR